MNEEHFRENESFEVGGETAPKKNPRPRGGKKGILLLVVVLVVIIGVGVFFAQKGNVAAAMVNGEKVTRAEYQERLKGVEREWEILYAQGAQSVPSSDPEAQALIKNAAINALVDEMLILGAARTAGLEATNTAVDTEMQRFRDSYETRTDFLADLRSVGMTERDLRELTKSQLSVQAYIDSVVPAENTEVSDAEMQSFFDDNREFLDESMTLEEFSNMYGEQLKAQKMQLAVAEVLEDLRDKAQIEILVDIPEMPEPETGVAPEEGAPAVGESDTQDSATTETPNTEEEGVETAE